MFDLNLLNKKYKMTELEIKALKVCNIWMELSRKVFPKYNHGKVAKGDPRKTLMFKVCYKLVRETEAFIEENDYQLYVRAQLDILKHISLEKGHPLIDVNCLIGDKAWKRWKLWKKKYDTTVQIRSKSTNIKKNTNKINDLLKKTRDFFKITYGDSMNFEKFIEIEKNGDLYQHLNLGRISPYYLVLSPFFGKISNNVQIRKIHFDLNIYKNGVDESVIEYFRNLFNYEFDS